MKQISQEEREEFFEDVLNSVSAQMPVHTKCLCKGCKREALLFDECANDIPRSDVDSLRANAIFKYCNYCSRYPFRVLVDNYEAEGNIQK